MGSAHNQQEIHKKISQNCKAIFLSPLFYIKKSKKFLGLHKFNYLCYMNKINILALGGISEKNIQQLKLLYSQGFGGIRKLSVAGQLDDWAEFRGGFFRCSSSIQPNRLD